MKKTSNIEKFNIGPFEVDCLNFKCKKCKTKIRVGYAKDLKILCPTCKKIMEDDNA